MKQKEDDKTVDMFGEAPSSRLYRFYIVVRDGAGGENEVEWRGLSLTVAKSMYAYTNRCQPNDVIRCGWEELG